jgi:hypothetical protein
MIVNTDKADIVDTSHVDAALASARRTEESARKRALIGAAGKAALMGGIGLGALCFGASFFLGPHIATRTVTVEIPVYKPVEKPFDNYVPHPVPFDLPTPHHKPAPMPPGPLAYSKPHQTATPLPSPPPLPPKTPDEKEREFQDRPDSKTAEIKGRILKSFDSDLHFDNGKKFLPAKLDTDGRPIRDPDVEIESDKYVGDYGYCNKNANDPFYSCFAIHNDVVEELPHGPRTRPFPDETQANGPPPSTPDHSPTPIADSMVEVDVDAGGYPIKAMVDTGCSYPMTVPRVLADALVDRGVAVTLGDSLSVLADGTQHKVKVISIDTVTVEGRTLHNVMAAVNESDSAPILLGLGALNKLTPYHIANGRLVLDGGPT